MFEFGIHYIKIYSILFYTQLCTTLRKTMPHAQRWHWFPRCYLWVEEALVPITKQLSPQPVQSTALLRHLLLEYLRMKGSRNSSVITGKWLSNNWNGLQRLIITRALSVLRRQRMYLWPSLICKLNNWVAALSSVHRSSRTVEYTWMEYNVPPLFVFILI